MNTPLIEWIGPFMQDFKDELPNQQELNQKDISKIYDLLTKPYMSSDPFSTSISKYQ